MSPTESVSRWKLASNLAGAETFQLGYDTGDTPQGIAKDEGVTAMILLGEDWLLSARSFVLR